MGRDASEGESQGGPVTDPADKLRCPRCACPLSRVLARAVHVKNRGGKKEDVTREKRECEHCDKVWYVTR